MKFLNKKPILLLYLFFYFLPSCKNDKNTFRDGLTINTQIIPHINYSLVKEFSHDTALFTEGLVFHNGKIYESTGSPAELSYTKSLVIAHDLSIGSFESKIELDKEKYFGEGIVFLKDKLFQLTYKNQEGFIYDSKNFKKIGTFSYSNKEGWGLTTDGINLIMSDGSDKLTFINANSLKPVRTLSITENNVPVNNINELELIKGFLYANIWQTNNIVKIDTTNGEVVGKLDLTSLVVEAKTKNLSADVLNGIAYDSINDKTFVTGKLWANIYEIKFPH